MVTQQVSEREEAHKTSQGLGCELAFSHLYHILLAKAGHEVGPDSRDGDVHFTSFLKKVYYYYFLIYWGGLHS